MRMTTSALVATAMSLGGAEHKFMLAHKVKQKIGGGFSPVC